MKQFEFLDPLEDIIVEQFEVLDGDYARDMAKDILRTISGAVEQENEIRYLVVDGETKQLESRRLFEEYQETLDYIKAKNLTHCQVGTLILEQ